MKRIYVSFPIAGYDIEERQAYDVKVRSIVQNKFPDDEVLTPFSMCPYDPERSYQDCMKDCISNLYSCDILVICPNWIASTGCRDEYFSSCNFGLDIYELDNDNNINRMHIGSIEVNLLKASNKALEKQKQKVN